MSDTGGLPNELSQPTADTPGPESTGPSGGSSDPGLGEKLRRLDALCGPGPERPAELPDVPGYELLGVVARGGQGAVYQARDRRLRRPVALKMVLDREYAEPSELARFRREAEALASLGHPNIVQIYEIGEHAGLPFLALEFVAGGSLARALDGVPQPPQRAADLLLLLARAMHFAHQHQLVHRDLKPGNVLLTDDGVPKITDFGLAKKLDQEQGQTQSGAILGTPSYMAPEQAWGKSKVHQVGPAADIYALGAVLYEMLTGRPPFRGETPLDTLQLVLTEEPVPPRRLQPKVPRDLETICLKCLQKQPKKRYATAQDLAEDLARFLRGEPIHARPVGRLERLGRWCRRNPALAATGALAGAALVTVVIGLAVLYGNAAELAETSSARARADEAKARAEEAARIQGEEKVKVAQAAQRRADRDAIQLLFEKATTQCQKDAAGGLLWLARGLDRADRAQAPDLERAFQFQMASWSRYVHPLEAILEHKGIGTAKLFSPDGKLFLTLQDKEVRLWETATGKPVGPPLRHARTIYAVAFRADGKAVLTGGWDAKAQQWDVATGKPVGPPIIHEGKLNPDQWGAGGIYTAAFSPDGKTVLTGSAVYVTDLKTKQTKVGWGEACLWDAQTGKLLHKPARHPEAVKWVLFGPDGKTFLTGMSLNSWGPGEVQLWDAATGKKIADLPHLRNNTKWSVQSAAYSPDGGLILTSGSDGTGRLWEAATGHLLGEPLSHVNIVMGFSPDGRTFLTVRGHSAQLWETAGLSHLGEPLRHWSGVTTAAFSPDGKTLATGSFDRTVQLWEYRPTTSSMESGTRNLPRYTFERGKFVLVGGSPVKPAAPPPARGSGPPVPSPPTFVPLPNIVSPGTVKPLGPPLPQPEYVQSVRFSPDGRSLLVVTPNQARRYRVATGGTLDPALSTPQPVRAVAFSPDGKRLVTGMERDYLHAKTAEGWVWDVGAGRPLGQPLVHSGSIIAVAFSPDGELVATGSQDGTAQLWHAATGKPAGPLLRHDHWVETVAFSPDGKTLATGGYGKFNPATGVAKGEARLWDVATGKLRFLLPHEAQVTRVAFSPDGRTVLCNTAATPKQPAAARLWAAATGRPLRPLLVRGKEAGVVALSPGGRLALAAGDGQTACVFEAATGKARFTFPYPKGDTPAALSPNGRAVITLAGDGTARVWDAATGKARLALPHRGSVYAAAFSPDGNTFLTSSGWGNDGERGAAGEVWLWDLTTGKPVGPPLALPGPTSQAFFSPDGKRVLTAWGEVRLWDASSLAGGPERLRLWAEVITGQELDEVDVVRPLPPPAWEERLRKLAALGGPPRPDKVRPVVAPALDPRR